MKKTRYEVLQKQIAKGGGNIVMPVPIGVDRVLTILHNLRFSLGMTDGIRPIHPTDLESYLSLKKMELLDQEVDLILHLSTAYVNAVHSYNNEDELPPYDFHTYVNQVRGKDTEDGKTS